MPIICFSATASFSASAVLFTIGAVTMRQTSARAQLPYAAIPLLFASQQFIEGWQWLALHGAWPASHALAVAYLLFSHVLWPIFVPIAVWLIEPPNARRKLIMVSVIAGAGVSLFFLYCMATNPVSASIRGMHIKYHLPHPDQTLAFSFYAIATCLAPLLSSHRWVRIFGLVLIGSMIAAYAIYATTFASVWCFFAALTSAIVFAQISVSRAQSEAPQAEPAA